MAVVMGITLYHIFTNNDVSWTPYYMICLDICGCSPPWIMLIMQKPVRKALRAQCCWLGGNVAVNMLAFPSTHS
uniref:G_PROTEIN_RECEP_F1_2 domain-containing protein n=1 Tax=Panagrellus redivivus TaxID=6233 RepID=A0A7E4V6G1_PANRE